MRKLLTVDDVLTTQGRHAERLRFVTPEIRANASIMAERANALSIIFGHDFELTSGFRDPASNRKCDGAPRSWHLRALALDIADVERTLERFIADSRALAACGLWAEAPDEKTRTHIQTEAPRGWKPGDSRILRK